MKDLLNITGYILIASIIFVFPSCTPYDKKKSFFTFIKEDFDDIEVIEERKRKDIELEKKESR